MMSEIIPQKSACVVLCGLLGLLLLFGCGRSGPEIVPVHGTITLGGGPWPKPGVLVFAGESAAGGETVPPPGSSTPTGISR